MRLLLLALFVVGMIVLDVSSNDDIDPFASQSYVILFECDINGSIKQIVSHDYEYNHYFDVETNKEIEITEFINLTDVKCKYINE